MYSSGDGISAASPSLSPSTVSSKHPETEYHGSLSADVKSLTSIDNRSMVSATSLASAAARDDSQSMIAMAGSFTSHGSHISKLSNELVGQASAAGPGSGDKVADQMALLAGNVRQGSKADEVTNQESKSGSKETPGNERAGEGSCDKEVACGGERDPLSAQKVGGDKAE